MDELRQLLTSPNYAEYVFWTLVLYSLKEAVSPYRRQNHRIPYTISPTLVCRWEEGHWKSQ